MTKSYINLPEMTLVGISGITSNAQEATDAAKIGGMFARYFAEGIFNQIQNRIKPGTFYSCYTKYDSDHTGEYTYFLGEQVESNASVPEGLDVMIVPPQSYCVFTPEPGPMPQACIAAWQEIWGNDELTSKRSYLADFERYDMSKMTPDRTEFDILVGVA